MRFSIVIPCYNERDNLEGLLERLEPLQEGYGLECVLVENGSTDGSREYFESEIEGGRPGVRAVYVPANRGYGYGIQQGLKAATGEYVGWMHADMQVEPSALEPVLRFLSGYHGGERYFFKGLRKGRGAIDRFFTGCMSLYESALFQMKIYDIGGFPVLFHRSLLDLAGDVPDDFQIELYMYVLAKGSGYLVKRFPVSMGEREHGASSWDRGLSSKIKNSVHVFCESLSIARRYYADRRGKGHCGKTGA